MKSIPFHFSGFLQIRRAFPALVLFTFLAGFTPALAGKNSEKTVWRIADTDSGKVYFAEAIAVSYSCPAGGFLTANGTVTFKLIHDKHATMAHISSEDASYPFSVPGTKADVRGSVTGTAFITSGGEQTPRIVCHKFASVSFKDLRSKSKVSVTRFTADEVSEGEVADDPATKK